MRYAAILLALGLCACAAQAPQPQAVAPAECRADFERVCTHISGQQQLSACVRDNIAEISRPCRRALRALRDTSAEPTAPNDDSGSAAEAPRLAPSLANIIYRTPPAGVPPEAVSLDFYRGPEGVRAPLVVFIHGGGWRNGDKRGGERGQPGAMAQAGFAYASLNYRLLEHGRPHVAADDIAAAIASLRNQADEYGIDPDRIAIMGHSAGAHLAALVGLDPTYLRSHGVPTTSVRALVLLDGAGYDIPNQIDRGGNAALYRSVFGDDADYWRRMSPLSHADRAGLPAALIHHSEGRAASRLQAQALAEALRTAGGEAQVHEALGEDHASINRGFGEPGDETTRLTMAFLAAHLRAP